MTAWGVVAVCAIGGGVAGPFVERVARRARAAPAGDASLPVAARTTPTVAATTPTPPTVATTTPTPPTVAATLMHDGTATLMHDGTAGGPAAPRSVPKSEIAMVTVVTAAACALAAVRLGAVPSLAAYCALFGGLVAVSVADLRSGLVPRRILYPALGLVAVGLAAASADVGEWRPLLDAAIGAAVAFAVFYAIWWIYPKGLGFGDVRLAALCGLGLGFLGFRQLYVGFLAAFLFGALGGLFVLARRGARRFPFAPALAAGTAFGVLWGGWLGNLWLHPG